MKDTSRKICNPYTRDGKVALIPSWVCYVDILGYQEFIANASGNAAQKSLLKLHGALNKAYKKIRDRAESFRPGEPFFAVKIFTDNIVIGYPTSNPDFDHGEGELGHVLSTLASFQSELATHGFLVRGGIAFGDHYMDDEITFGNAFLDAVKGDSSGGAPRIVLRESATEKVQHHLGFYGDGAHAPQHEDLLQDADKVVFLNYLAEAFSVFPEGGVFLDLIQEHRNTVIIGLEKHQGSAGVTSKYEWAARYHNYVCKDFLDRHSPSGPDVDEFYAAACAEAAVLSSYIIDIDAHIATPARMDLKPIPPGPW